MPKLMLIEDDTTMYSLLSMLLKMEGYQVVPDREEKIDQVLAVIRREMPDLILVDVNLSQFNGFDLLHLIRSESSLADIRVVMSSGMDYTTKCLKEGADDFILKPYMPDDLIHMIRESLKIVRN